MWIIQKSFLVNQDPNYLSLFQDHRVVETIEDVYKLFYIKQHCFLNCDCKFAGNIDFVEKLTFMFGDKRDFSIKSYDCREYYPYIGFDLVNYNNIIIQFDEIQKNFFDICKRFNCDKFFIRPVSGDKLFTGTYFTKKWVHKELEIIQEVNNVKLSNELVLIAPFQEIYSEYRIAFKEGKAIGAAGYSENCNENIEYIKQIAQSFFNRSLYKYKKLNRFFTMDICKIPINKWKVVEINGFGTAGLYGMNFNEILL